MLKQPPMFVDTNIARHHWDRSDELYKLGQLVNSGSGERRKQLQYFVHLCVLHLAPKKLCVVIVRRMLGDG